MYCGAMLMKVCTESAATIGALAGTFTVEGLVFRVAFCGSPIGLPLFRRVLPGRAASLDAFPATSLVSIFCGLLCVSLVELSNLTPGNPCARSLANAGNFSSMFPFAFPFTVFRTFSGRFPDVPSCLFSQMPPDIFPCEITDFLLSVFAGVASGVVTGAIPEVVLDLFSGVLPSVSLCIVPGVVPCVVPEVVLGVVAPIVPSLFPGVISCVVPCAVSGLVLGLI